MAEPGMPRRSVSTRSASEGSPDAVEVSRNVPDAKLRGFGYSRNDAGPSPSPFAPWQTAH